MSYIATAQIIGTTQYSQSFQHGTEKLNKELADAYEERTWRKKMHSDPDGNLVIPAMAFKHCIAEAAKFLSIQIPGKGKSTYTKHFESGILCLDDVLVYVKGHPIKVQDVPGRWINVPSDGVPGSGKRVRKCFPMVPAGWEGTVQFAILDDVITAEVFRDHLVQAGQLIGIGSFRVRNRGTCGRFKVKQIEWQASETKDSEVPIIKVA